MLRVRFAHLPAGDLRSRRFLIYLPDLAPFSCCLRRERAAARFGSPA